jgi:poly(glycerol-phosphate) alpha-glucosyltransferase
VNVFGLADSHTATDRQLWSPIAPQGFTPAMPRRLGYSRPYLKQLLATPADVAHLHVLWMYQSAMVYKWHKKYNKPYITTINGMLDPWAIKNAQLKKRIALLLYEYKALNACSCFQVNSQKECDDVRAFGLKKPVAIIKNGITIPDLYATYNQPPWKGKIPPNKRVLLYLSRVHPKKGLPNVIEALAILKQSNFPELNDWMLVVVGCVENGGHEKELVRLVSKYSLQDQILFLKQHFHEDVYSCFYNSNAYILPSYSEGMPMAALEAWAFGKYSLLTPACNLSEGYKAGVAYHIEPNPDSIVNGLRYVFTRSDAELKNLGLQAHQFASFNYSWGKMAHNISEVYRWVSGQGPKPTFVQFN